MIISASRRTDIPAFYSEWFFNRLVDGYFYIYNKRQNKYEKIPLTPDVVDCIVFWTKNPKPLMKHLNQMRAMGYNYYFQFSLTPYSNDIELNISDKKEILNTFKELSKMIGPEKVVWRYDPILINNKYNIDFHIKSFKQLCKALSGFTNECVISFVDSFTKGHQLQYYEAPNLNEIITLAESFSQTAKKYNITIKTCAEMIDLSEYGIQHSACIDKDKIESILSYRIDARKDHSQREYCNCVSSLDVGEYFTCLHRCSYCYAGGTDKVKCEHNHSLNNSDSPLFVGKPEPNIKSVKSKKYKSLVIDEQLKLL